MKQLAAVAVALAAAAQPCLSAGTEPQHAADSLGAITLQDVQVTATRVDWKSPVAHTTIGKNGIDPLNKGKDLPAILALTPSVTFTSDAGNGIGYTALRVRGSDPTRVNITVNGVPMNDAESSSLYWVNMADFASNIESAQLQRGVGTSTNGAGAFGATLNMQTSNIGPEPYTRMDFSAGSYGTHKESLSFSTGLSKAGFGLQGRLSNISSDGYIDRAWARLGSYFLQAGYLSGNTMVKLITFNGQERTYHAWNYASKYEQALYGRRYNSCGEYYGAGGKPMYYDGQEDRYHQQNYQLLANHSPNPHFNLSAALHYTKGDGYYEEYKVGRKLREYLLAGPFSADKSDLVRRKHVGSDFYGFTANASYDTKDGLKAVAGVAWNRYDGIHYGRVIWAEKVDGGLPLNHEYYNNESKKTDFNAFLKTTWEFAARFSAFADLQYRKVSYSMSGPGDEWDGSSLVTYGLKDRFDFFNPKFGLTYRPSDSGTAYVSYSIAHREPTRNDYEDNYGTALKAEKMGDLEIGYRYSSPVFSAAANIYYMHYNNQFVLTGELNEIGEMKASNQNSGRSHRLGIELEAAWQIAKWIRWDGNATISHNRAHHWTVQLEDGTSADLGSTPLSFSPAVITNHTLTANLGAFTAQLQGRYVGKQYLTNTGFDYYTTTDENGDIARVDMAIMPYFTANADVSYKFLPGKLSKRHWTVGCAMYNLFSALYDNNGWAAPSFRKGADGKVEAAIMSYSDMYSAGFAPSAPFNFLAYLSINF